MKPNANIKLFLMLIVLLASFALKNYGGIVDEVYAAEGGTAVAGASLAAARVSDQQLKEQMLEEALKFVETRGKIEEMISHYREQIQKSEGLKKYESIADSVPKIIEEMEKLKAHRYLALQRKKALQESIEGFGREGSDELFRTVEKMDSDIKEKQKQIDELLKAKADGERELADLKKVMEKKEETEKVAKENLEAARKVECEAKKVKEREKIAADRKAKRELKKARETLFGRVWSDFSPLLKDYDLDDSSMYEEVKEETDEFIKEEVSDFLDKEFKKVDAASLLRLDFRQTKIDRELKRLDRTIRELRRKGRHLESKPLSSDKDEEPRDKELRSIAIELYAAKRMKSKIESGVEKRFEAVRDNVIAAQTRSDQISAQQERTLAMAKMFESGDPLTKMLLLEMFGDPSLAGGGAPAEAPQGFSLDIGGTPGGGLRLGLGAQGAQSGFALDFSQQPKDPFSRLFPGSGYGGFDPVTFDPRRFGGSYWGN